MSADSTGTTKPYYTSSEVARLFMVSPITVRQWTKKGAIKAILTPGGHRRFLRAEIERFAAKNGLSLRQLEGEMFRVLIVDDDSLFCSFLKEVLDTLPGPIDVEIACNGFMAGQLIHTFQPNVVILDLGLPQMDGFEVCSQIKGDPTTKDIRVIAMTGFPTQEKRDKAIELGCVACLSKPFESETLVDALALGRKEALNPSI